MPSPKILVTGGTGFIGRYAVERLRTNGVEPLVTSSVAARSIQALDLRDEKAARALIESYRPEIVLHLAGVTGASTDAGLCHSVNYVGTVNLLNALAETEVSRGVLIGTAAEYGEQQPPFREDMPPRPVSPYAVSKARATEYALDAYARTGLPVTVLRVFTAYGYGQPGKMFLSQLMSHALDGTRAFKMSDGLQKRDLVYVEDVVDAIIAASTCGPASGRVINIGSGRAIALRDLAVKIWSMCGAEPNLLRTASIEKTADDAFDTEADISLAARLLGWRPATPYIGDARDGHPIFVMIEKMRADIARRHDKGSGAGISIQ
jgi:nucleoside-diphosphate-sugar epimerase